MICCVPIRIDILDLAPQLLEMPHGPLGSKNTEDHREMRYHCSAHFALCAVQASSCSLLYSLMTFITLAGGFGEAWKEACGPFFLAYISMYASLDVIMLMTL